MDAMKTGELIAQVRKEKGLTQRELAEKVYVSVQAVSKWELGKNFPDLSLMEPLADVLGLTVSELLAGRQGEEPQDALVRDTLRLGEEQLRPKIKKWRERFITAAVLLALLLMGLAGLWVDRNTVKPQPETIVEEIVLTENEQAMVDLLNVQTGDYSYLGMYNVTIADDMDGYRIAAELWTREGLKDSWDLRSSKFFRETESFSGSQLLAFRIPIGQGEGSRYRIRFGSGTVSGFADIFDSVLPYLDNGSTISYASRAVVDREHGAVLMELGLNEEPGGYWRTQILGITDDPQPGTLEEGTASLILKLYWD
jgi:transcriptional regulator with XRE-family HTH domain